MLLHVIKNGKVTFIIIITSSLPLAVGFVVVVGSTAQEFGDPVDGGGSDVYLTGAEHKATHAILRLEHSTLSTVRGLAVTVAAICKQQRMMFFLFFYIDINTQIHPLTSGGKIERAQVIQPESWEALLAVLLCESLHLFEPIPPPPPSPQPPPLPHFPTMNQSIIIHV
jgi:hypothetical protein